MKILHIEDHEDFSYMLSAYLQSKLPHIKIMWGKDYNTYLVHLGNGPDLIICNLKIPTWPNHLREIFDSRGGIPLIVLTGASEDTLAGPKLLGIEIFTKSPKGLENLLEYLQGFMTKYR
jgi:response regulator RpfG family c-di-GMP phosphodiesterase